jgi:hypothetical protein
MDLFTNASDDQIALMGCAAALFVFGGLMYVSFFIGRSKQTEEQPQTVSLEAHRAVPQESQERRAA